MIDLTGMASLLLGVTLLAFTALGLTAAARLKGLVANSLALALVAYAIIVALTQILSELHQVNRAGFLIGQTVLALVAVRWSFKLLQAYLGRAGVIFFNRRERLRRGVCSHPALAVLAGDNLDNDRHLWDSPAIKFSKISRSGNPVRLSRPASAWKPQPYRMQDIIWK